MLRSPLLGFAVAVALPALSASAAPATPEEAARLAAVLARYVASPGPGQPPSVTVVPQGESYVATLDLKRALAGLEGLGFTLDPVTSVDTLTPLPDGTWRVASADSPTITVHAGAQTLSFKSAASSFEGVFDPKLPGFTRARQEQTGVDTVQTTPTQAQDRRVDRLVLDLTGAAADKGVDARGRYGLTGASGTVVFRPAPDAGAPAAGAPPAGTALGYKAPTGAVDVGLDRFRTGAALDLWRFLVAHPDRASLVAAQGELKATLHAGLPYAAALRESGSFDAPSLTTPAGVVSAKAFRAGVDASGLDGAGRAALTIAVEDLAVPPGQLPPWSAGLVPTAIDLHVSADGFHAAEAASALVDDVDLAKEVVITPEQKAAVGRLFWPGGTVTVAPSRITTGALDLRVEGQAKFDERAGGRFTVTATGLDKEIAALQASAAADPGAAQVMGPLALAKNLAKPGPDGSLVWVIDFGEGGLKVNGAALQ